MKSGEGEWVEVEEARAVAGSTVDEVGIPVEEGGVGRAMSEI